MDSLNPKNHQQTPTQPPTTKLTPLQHHNTNHNANDDDDAPPALSSYALEALQDFLASQSISNGETQHKQQQLLRGGENGEFEADDDDVVTLVSEDWRLSQFWYSPSTAITVAQEIDSLLSRFDFPASVACISCPTLFIYIKKMYPAMSAQLFEYDQRFEQYGSDFTFYDYNSPEDLPQTMKHTYQIIVADPPYLSEECLKKVALTIQFLAQPEKNFMLLLTGEVQRDRAAKYLGLHPCGFRPEHSSKLGNEFLLYTNYNPDERLGAWELEV